MFEIICFVIRVLFGFVSLMALLSLFWFVTWVFFLHRFRPLREVLGLEEIPPCNVKSKPSRVPLKHHNEKILSLIVANPIPGHSND